MVCFTMEIIDFQIGKFKWQCHAQHTYPLGYQNAEMRCSGFKVCKNLSLKELSRKVGKGKQMKFLYVGALLCLIAYLHYVWLHSPEPKQQPLLHQGQILQDKSLVPQAPHSLPHSGLTQGNVLQQHAKQKLLLFCKISVESNSFNNNKYYNHDEVLTFCSARE